MLQAAAGFAATVQRAAAWLDRQDWPITLSERANASNRARVREAQLLDLLDGSIQGILILRRFQPLFANGRAAGLLGFQSVADLMTRSALAHMIVADDLPVVDRDSKRRTLDA